MLRLNLIVALHLSTGEYIVVLRLDVVTIVSYQQHVYQYDCNLLLVHPHCSTLSAHDRHPTSQHQPTSVTHTHPVAGS